MMGMEMNVRKIIEEMIEKKKKELRRLQTI